MNNYKYSPLDYPQRIQLYQRLILRGILTVVIGFFLVFILPKILPFMMPFLIAFLAAMLLNPIVSKLEKKAHVNRRISAFVLTFFVVSVLFLFLGLLIRTIYIQSVSLASNFNSIWDYTLEKIIKITEKLDWLMKLLPGSSKNTLSVLEENIYSWLKISSDSIMDTALSAASSTTSRISSILLTFIITLLAVYFAIADYERFSSFAKDHTEHNILNGLQKLKNAVQSALGGYLRSQLALALLAFSVMFAALFLYRQKYALLIALGLAFVDLLPIVGTIAVLIPWSAIEYMNGGTSKAVFLLILAIGFFILRKILEPKIVGSQTGLHPLTALACIYIGINIAGVWGAILAPIVAMIAINIYSSGMLNNTILDLKDLYHIFRSIFKREDE